MWGNCTCEDIHTYTDRNRRGGTVHVEISVHIHTGTCGGTVHVEISVHIHTGTDVGELYMGRYPYIYTQGQMWGNCTCGDIHTYTDRDRCGGTVHVEISIHIHTGTDVGELYMWRYPYIYTQGHMWGNCTWGDIHTYTHRDRRGTVHVEISIHIHTGTCGGTAHVEISIHIHTGTDGELYMWRYPYIYRQGQTWGNCTCGDIRTYTHRDRRGTVHVEISIHIQTVTCGGTVHGRYPYIYTQGQTGNCTWGDIHTYTHRDRRGTVHVEISIHIQTGTCGGTVHGEISVYIQADICGRISNTQKTEQKLKF
ncbi:hypothetical protein LEMLEM_LOCUS3862 [Lemmus lemmus]